MTAALEDRIAELEEYTRRVIPARDGTDGWCNYISSSIAAAISQQRDYFFALLPELIAGLQRDFRDEMRAMLDAALTTKVRGTYRADVKYERGDMVALDGGSFVARKDDPGPCPSGGGWQLMAKQGARGRDGPEGRPGPKGAIISGWIVDRSNYRVTPRFSDGTLGPPLELAALFEPSETTP